MTNPFTYAGSSDNRSVADTGVIEPSTVDGPTPAQDPTPAPPEAAGPADPQTSEHESESHADPKTWPPLWSVMAAVEHSGASTLDRWCACSQEITRAPSWRPDPGHSPYIVLTTLRTVEGIRRARQLAGALTSTAGGAATVAAIVALAPEPSTRTGSGIQLKEMIAAAEAAGVPIIGHDHDPVMHGQIEPPEGVDGWTPKSAENSGIPTGLARTYTRIFFAIVARMVAEQFSKEAQ